MGKKLRLTIFIDKETMPETYTALDKIPRFIRAEIIREFIKQGLETDISTDKLKLRQAVTLKHIKTKRSKNKNIKIKETTMELPTLKDEDDILKFE